MPHRNVKTPPPTRSERLIRPQQGNQSWCTTHSGTVNSKTIDADKANRLLVFDSMANVSLPIKKHYHPLHSPAKES